MARHSFKRCDRIGQLLHREIGNILQFEVNDSRLRVVTVTKVRLTEDLKEARVYVSVGGEQKRMVMKSLSRAGKFIRACIGRRCYLKYVPDLTFKLDTTGDDAARIDSLIDSLRAGKIPDSADGWP